MNLAIIIPTYNSLETFKVLIEHVYRYTEGDFRVYVVEDAVDPKNVEYIKKLKHRNLEPIFHEVNKGIAVSWNDGLKAALKDECTHFAVFNDDIELCEDWWESCQKEFEKGAHMVCLDQPCPFPLTGWFFILDRYCLDEIGLFDEQFQGYTSEDADYFLRIQDRGLKYVRIPLKIFHHGSATLGKLKKESPEKFKEIWNDNWQRLRRKYPHKRMTDQSI